MSEHEVMSRRLVLGRMGLIALTAFAVPTLTEVSQVLAKDSQTGNSEHESSGDSGSSSGSGSTASSSQGEKETETETETDNEDQTPSVTPPAASSVAPLSPVPQFL